MSSINTDYATFNVVDYKNEAVLSSYNLSITPLTFKASIPTQAYLSGLSNAKALYDFGDGTVGNGLTSQHVYQIPGLYNVKMVMRDSANNAVLASYSANVQIYDYLENTFTATISSATLNLSAGEFSEAITIASTSPKQQPLQNIFFSVSGNKDDNFFNLDSNRFNHLKDSYSLYTKSYNNYLSASEFIEIDKVSLSGVSIFAQLSANTIVHTASGVDSIFVGMSGNSTVYAKFDTPTDRVDIAFYKDRDNTFSRRIDTFGLNDFNNTSKTILSAVVGANAVPTMMSITSNGLDGEGIEPTSFNICPTQYKGCMIPFVIKPKSALNFTNKNVSLSTNPTVQLLSGGDVIPSSYYNITSLSATLSTLPTDFWYIGGLTFNDNISSAPTSVTLNITGTFVDLVSTFKLNTSSDFTCYPQDYYEMYKHNEDFDFEQTIKDLRFSEILLDKEIFFTDFIGSIFGSVSSKYDTLGKKLYERIFNFVSNTQDIDVCSISSLNSIATMLNEEINVYDAGRYIFPESVGRAMSLLSVKFRKLFGYGNQFDQNFDTKGHTSKDYYGTNLGDNISVLTYNITAGTPIVARENFSGVMIKLNTFQPLCATSSSQYKLSAFSTDWGWPMVLPASPTYVELDKFYTFYEFTPGINGTINDGVLDFANTQTTIDSNTPLSSFIGANNISDIIIQNTLFSSLSLFEG